jgi:glycosyltransferase involved in cell wall biosynthesis
MLRRQLLTGVDRVSLEYVRHFRARAHALIRIAGRWVVMNHRNSHRVFDALLAPDRDFLPEIRWCLRRSYALSWGGSDRPFVLLNISHSGLDSPGYARQVRRRGWKSIFFLHDLIPITHPEYCRSGEADKHGRRLETMLFSGQGLIVNSSATRDTLKSFAARRGWPVPPCVIAPPASARLPAPAATRPLAEPYFVVLGTIEPRKNHLLLLQLWKRLAEELEAAAPRLVVIGQRGWECEQVLDLLERCAALQRVVVEQSRCNDAELSTWLHHARALLFPSFAEGYGIPLVEALSHGVPVIASDLPVFREIAQDIPDYLDPNDWAGWKRTILDYTQPESSARLAQCARLEGFRAPTWEKHFAMTEELMREVYGCP